MKPDFAKPQLNGKPFPVPRISEFNARSAKSIHTDFVQQ
tara:strand:+ start:210 stop:326 length:117 start_codon:yes stop_codon:yes gene_type:complete